MNQLLNVFTLRWYIPGNIVQMTEALTASWTNFKYMILT